MYFLQCIDNIFPLFVYKSFFPTMGVTLQCTVVEGGDKTYLATFEYWFKLGFFGQFWIYFDGIQALNYFWMMIYVFSRAPKAQKLTISDDF